MLELAGALAAGDVHQRYLGLTWEDNSGPLSPKSPIVVA